MRARRIGLVVVALLAMVPGKARGQDQRFYLGGQANIIFQQHPAFPAPYSGPHSLRPDAEHATSIVLTLYTGLRLGSTWEAIVDVESVGGGGLSEALGLAGFADLDVVRNPSLGPTPYLARAMIRKIVALSDDTVETTPTPFALSSRLPARRLEIRAGKMSLVDFFDLNAVGSDSHLQFTNWTVDNNGAFDYAADTRGYTYAALVEYDTPRWAVRAADALMPKTANGLDLDWHLDRSHAENVELEVRPADAVVVRTLAYANHANMGSYTDAIRAFKAGEDPVPDVTAHRSAGRAKYGFGLNAEYGAPGGLRLFGRTGWNEGEHESFAYTEVNDTIAIGGDVSGARWRRSRDRFGLAFVSNGLSGPHREYLALGGLGFLLGDGALGYGRESIVESYYTAHVYRGLYGSAGLQAIRNPGYNRDRGPVVVFMLRAHLDL